MSTEDEPIDKELKKPTNRVKLYHLNEKGLWDDKGTGFVSISKVLIFFYFKTQINDIDYIQLKAESNNEDLLLSEVMMDDVYSLQNGTNLLFFFILTLIRIFNCMVRY